VKIWVLCWKSISSANFDISEHNAVAMLKKNFKYKIQYLNINAVANGKENSDKIFL